MKPPIGLEDEQKQHVAYSCPHCAVLSQHQKQLFVGPQQTRVIETKDQTRAEYHSLLKHYILRCLNCGRDTYLLFQPAFRNGSMMCPGSEAVVLHAYPSATPLAHKAVPEAIQKAAVEAEKCFGVGAYNACGVMTRRSMHSLCEDKNAQGKDLFDQLKFLRDNHAITPDLWEWSEELRALGKHGAHPEWEEVTEEDAEYGVKFLREIVRYVYILPHERSERRIKETSKKV